MTPDSPQECVLRGKDVIISGQLHPAHGAWKSCNHQQEEFTRGLSYHRGSRGVIWCAVLFLPLLLPILPLAPLLSTRFPGKGLLSSLCTWKSKWRSGPHCGADCPISERELVLQLNSVSWALLAGHQNRPKAEEIFFYLLLSLWKRRCNILTWCWSCRALWRVSFWGGFTVFLCFCPDPQPLPSHPGNELRYHTAYICFLHENALPY